MLRLTTSMKNATGVDILEEVFSRDGSLRDIYVCNSTAHDWQKFVTFVHEQKYQTTYELEGIETPLPHNFEEIHKRMGELHQLLSINVKSVRLNCHFFWIEEIELDLLPNEVNTEEQAEAVFEFMAEVGRALDKEVILTPENGREYTIVCFDPKAGEVEYNRG